MQSETALNHSTNTVKITNEHVAPNTLAYAPEAKAGPSAGQAPTTEAAARSASTEAAPEEARATQVQSARQGYYMIHRFMTEELRLGGSRLLVYALIYSFTVAEGSFFGSRGYIARACGISVKTVDRALKELVTLKLLFKGERSHLESNEYVAYIPIKKGGVSQNGSPSKKSLTIGQNDEPTGTECLMGGVKNSPNNKEYNKTINQTNNHAMIKVTRARGEERNEEKSRSATGEYGEAVIVLRGDRSEREKRAELLKERIESGKFRGEIRVPDDIFLEEDLLRRKKGIVRSAYNKEFYLGDTLVPHGTTGKVFLSGSQYDFLRLTYGEELTEEYIRRLEEAMIAKPLFRSFSHFKTIIKWLAEDMQCGDPYEIGKER